MHLHEERNKDIKENVCYRSKFPSMGQRLVLFAALFIRVALPFHSDQYSLFIYCIRNMPITLICFNLFLTDFFHFLFAAIANRRFTQNPKRSSFYCAISFLKTWNFPSHYHHFARCNEGCTTQKLSTITMTIQLPPATEICTSRMPSNHIVRCVCSNNRRIIDFHIRYQSNCNLRQYPHYDTMNGTCYALEMSLAALLSCENEFWRSPFSHFIIAPSTSEWTWQIYCMRFAFETKASQCLFCMCARFFFCCKCIRDTSNAIKGKTHTNSADKIGIVTIIALEKKRVTLKRKKLEMKECAHNRMSIDWLSWACIFTLKLTMIRRLLCIALYKCTRAKCNFTRQLKCVICLFFLPFCFCTDIQRRSQCKAMPRRDMSYS